MDILQMIDRLEELLNESRPLPFTHNVIVDEDRMLDLIDQMRVSIPEEVKKAQQLLAQRDRLLAQAQEEANRTIAIARERSDQLIERDQVDLMVGTVSSGSTASLQEIAKESQVPLIVAPVTLLGMLLSKLLPDNRSLYLNNVIVAKKNI